MDLKKYDPRGGKKKKKKQVGLKLKINLWTVVIFGILAMLFLPLFFNASDFQGLAENVDISQAIVDIKEDRVDSIEIEDEKVNITYKDGTEKVAIKEEDETFAELLVGAEIDLSTVKYEVIDQSLS